MELSSSNIKNFLYFLERKFFLYLRKWNPALFTPSSKNKRNSPREHSYTLGNGNAEKNFLYFLKRKLFLYFRKRNFPSSRNEKNHS